MSEVFNYDELPEIDQSCINRGMCPWCLASLTDATLHGGKGDQCPECLDEFV